MARSRKGTPVPSFDERTRTILHLRWQALRRNLSYQLDVQECLSNLEALYDQLITQQQTLDPPPTLPENVCELAAKIDELLQHDRSPVYLTIPPPRLEDKRSLLLDLLLDKDAGALLQTLPAEARFDVAQKLLAYWQWQQTNKDLAGHIAAFEDLAYTLMQATNIFRSWDPSLDGLPEQSSKIPEPDMFKLEPDQVTLGKFTLLCSRLCREPAFFAHFPPLATLVHQWSILLPLDPEISELPLLAAAAVFPNTRPHDFSVTYGMKEFCAIITLKVSPGASKEPILAEFDNLLSFATSRLNRSSTHHPKSMRDIPYYSQMFEVYDRKCAGESSTAIAKQLWPKVFEDNQQLYDYANLPYRSALQRVNDLVEAAKHLIKTHSRQK
jgi:hypothetical protein